MIYRSVNQFIKATLNMITLVIFCLNLYVSKPVSLYMFVSHCMLRMYLSVYDQFIHVIIINHSTLLSTPIYLTT